MGLSDKLGMFRAVVSESHQLDVFDEFVFPHAKFLYDSAYRLCGNQDEAEDLMQETFLLAIKYFSQLKDQSKCKYWLFSILRNLFLRELEKGRKRVDLEFDLFSNSLCDISHIENEFLRIETEKVVRDSLEKLEEPFRKPILLFYFEQLSYKEIADLLSIPIGTVMSRIARGKVCLKQNLVRSEQFQAEIEPWLRKHPLSGKKRIY